MDHMPLDGDRRKRGRRALLALSVAIVAGTSLTSCKVSVVANHHYSTSEGTIRCATGQSTVGETADQGAGGAVTALAETKSMRDLNCVNPDALHPAWKDLGVYVELNKKSPIDGHTFVCADPGVVNFVWDDNHISNAVSGRCGYGNYFAVGQHLWVSNYGPSYTQDFNTITPLAWND